MIVLHWQFSEGEQGTLGDITHELCSPIAHMEMSLSILEDQLTANEAVRLAGVREEPRQISLSRNELISFSKAFSIVKTCISYCDDSVTASNREPHGSILKIELPRA